MSGQKKRTGWGRRPWFAMGLWLAVAGGLASAAWASRPKPRQIGNITYWAEAKSMPAPNPAPPVTQIDFRNFTYRLFPTEAAPDPEQAGIPAFDGEGQPLAVPVSDGHFDDRNNPQAPLELDIIRRDVAVLPHAPHHHMVVIFGILYTGQDTPMCTGVVQMFATAKKRLWLMAQFTYDCRGGMNAQYVAKKHQIQIRSAVFAPGDRPCCPSLQDAVNFKVDGRHVKPSDVVLAPGV